MINLLFGILKKNKKKDSGNQLVNYEWKVISDSQNIERYYLRRYMYRDSLNKQHVKQIELHIIILSK